MNRRLKMNKKGEKTVGVGVVATSVATATASVVVSRTLTSATVTTASPILTKHHHGKDNNIPTPSHPKSHPKTLDIPSSASTPVKKLTGINGSNVGSSSSSGGRGGVMIPPKGDKRSTVPVVPPRCTRDNSGSRDKIKNQSELQQQTSPGAATDNSGGSSSSSPRSGINPSQFASICKEISQVREEHMAIRKSLSDREGELGKTRVALRNIAQERDLLKSKVFELEKILKHSPELQSQVSALLTQSNTNSGFHTGTMTTSSTSPSAPVLSHYNNSASKTSSPSSLLSSPEQANSITKSVSPVQSPRRNIQQNQKQAQSPPSLHQQQQQRPDMVVLESPRKGIPNENGNNNLKRAGGGTNINCQESHLLHQQHNHNNKNLQQIHSFQRQQQQQTNMNNMNDKKSIYSHDMTQEQFQIHQGHLNGRNDYGNNNNNQLKNIATATTATLLTRGGGGGGDCSGGGHNNQHHLSQSGITGLDLMLLGPDSCSTKVVEHLVHPVQLESSIREIQHTLVLKGVPINGDRLREVEIEIDRLNSRIDHLRSQNDVLTLNLEDAKSHADRLTVLLGKYESNNVALQLALRYSDQMTDAYEILVALLETELGQVLAHIHAAGRMQSICSEKSAESPTNQKISGSTSGTLVVSSSRSSSGNNNNSNDNSPSEHVAPSVGHGQEEGTPLVEASGPGINEKVDEADEKFNGDKRHDDLGNNHPENGKIVQVMKNHHNNGQPEKITSPAIAMNLVEQAKRNRITAEKAARFLLSRFPQPPNNSSGMFLSPTESENNNGHNHIPVSPSSHRHHQNQDQSTSSIISSSESIASNLSNISGESCGQSCSISSDDENLREGNGTAKLVASNMSRETSAIITVGNDGTSNGEIMMRSSTGQSSSSPTGSTATFRASTTLENPTYVCTSIVSSCLPLLGSPKSGNPAMTSPPVESSIRSLISSLKAERDAIKQTVVMKLERESLESLTPSPNPTVIQFQYNNNNTSPTACTTGEGGGQHSSNWTHADARKLDLETAVLMQELMAMKEERAELRAQLFLVEKEKEALELRLGSYESQEEAYKTRIKFLKTEILECKGLYTTTTTTEIQNHNDRNKNDMMITTQQQQQNNENFRNKDAIINNNNNTNNANWEREVVLKKRIHELATALENVTTSTQLRERQHQEMICELNRANGILMQTLEVAKKKYQNRIKKMEDQIMYISEKYATQLRFFGEKSSGTMTMTGTGRTMKTTMKGY